VKAHLGPSVVSRRAARATPRFQDDQRRLLRHRALLEQVLHQADETRIAPRDSRLGREPDHLIVPGVDDRPESTLLVEERVETEEDEYVDEIRAASTIAVGEPVHRGMVQAAVQEERAGRPTSLLRGPVDRGVARDGRRDELETCLRQDEGEDVPVSGDGQIVSSTFS
jgi:hypothetical protein